jgi:hypothetical protein
LASCMRSHLACTCCIGCRPLSCIGCRDCETEHVFVTIVRNRRGQQHSSHAARAVRRLIPHGTQDGPLGAQLWFELLCLRLSLAVGSALCGWRPLVRLIMECSIWPLPNLLMHVWCSVCGSRRGRAAADPRHAQQHAEQPAPAAAVVASRFRFCGWWRNGATCARAGWKGSVLGSFGGASLCRFLTHGKL